MKILVVDDEEAIRYSLRELLTDAGNEVTEAEHGPAALTILSEQDVDLVISDLRMPAIDGLELLEHVRRDHPHALFVLMTAYGDERTAVQALQMGAFHYLPKPFDNDEIRAVVERAREMLTLRSENRRLREELAGEFRGIIGDAPAMREVYRVIRIAGVTDASVLVTGDSGTGKAPEAPAVPAVGPAPGQHGANIMAFCNEYNERTSSQAGSIIPGQILVYADRSFTFSLKTPPASDLIKKALGLEKGSTAQVREKVGTISHNQLRQIAEVKMKDLNANDIDAAIRMVEGTARSMGVEVGG